MKRFIIALTIIGLAVASCSLNPFDEPIVLKGKTVPVTINARQGDGDETKTVRNVDKSVSWMPSEEILVICGTDKGKFTSTNTENSPTVSFSGKLDEATVNAVNNGTSAYSVWGLYPYDENAESDGTYVTTTLPNVQTGVAGTFADDLFITLAKSDDFNLYFYNVCSGFKFSVTKAGVTSITIQGKNNEYLAGKVKLSFGGDGKPKVDEVLDGQKVITLTPEKSTFEVGKEYYFVTLPTDFSGGFTVTLNTPSETGVFDFSAPLSFPRSKFVTKANVDAAVAYGAKVGNINIPDSKFKEYCVEKFDGDHDGEISYTEALHIFSIIVETSNIANVQGIEFMSNLNTLSIVESDHNGKLSSLDVSNNLALEELYCYGNQLTALDVSNNTALTQLYCSNNQLTALDVSNHTALTRLDCFDNQLTSLDISNNTDLTYLDCSNNPLTTLNVSSNAALTRLICIFCQLTALDVSNNTDLTYLDCTNNSLTALDVSKNTDLTQLSCSLNQLTSLIVSGSTSLTGLGCHNNMLTALDVSSNAALTQLDCNSNQLTSLNVSNNTALTQLECWNNQLTALDVSKNTDLTGLNCSINQLTTLDVSKNLALKEFNCVGNLLTKLDVSNNSALVYLGCWSNPNLSEIWLKTGQTITDFQYDTSVATVKYKE